MSPLPRFHRLPAERRQAILGVARRYFAEQGPEGASYNKIIEAAGMSKTAAYQYFDGRDDLLAAVLDDVLERLLAALGTWQPARDPAAFRAALETGTRALSAHLREHPDDLVLAGAAAARAGGTVWTGWFTSVVADGQRIGVIRTDVDRELLVAATESVLRAGDAWALAAWLRDGHEPDTRQVWELLHGLWSGAADAR
ncbi:TetR/AcrR family transcriptional regulator [Streptomyces yaizuensis]|uniref:TetR/AcrR family transcriptional regulator n=1 Tax=Streptomyces yaizuensis TaxID=2989713 RepID=A0ABQ5NYL6_9ACTN|nr:TetR/AcrR family transcriptional regulator [Streptomyces sp. YSPA8]GLF95441.1 TetR/AcrR family transcriptional regulator [Streptomyces sp. YSPA8]